MLTNVMLTNLFLFYLLVRVARFMLGQPACARSFRAFGREEIAGGPSLAWNSPSLLGRPREQPFAEMTTMTSVWEKASAARRALLLGQKDVCHNVLVDRETLDAYFAQLGNLEIEFNDTLSQSSVTVGS